jgi:hypothetical protein
VDGNHCLALATPDHDVRSTLADLHAVELTEPEKQLPPSHIVVSNA